jgi:hypothetical protein
VYYPPPVLFAQWTTRIGGSGGDYSNRIRSDSVGNIYVAASYASNPLTIYNSDGSSFGTLGNSGSLDAYFVKYNTSGFAQWATRLAGSGDDRGYTIAADPVGNIYVLGQYTSNPLTIYNSDGSSFGTLGNSGGNDVCVVKYNTSGFAQWATRIGGSGDDVSFAGITFDLIGNIYVSGHYNSNPLTIYNSDGSSFGTLGNSGSYDIYVVKYNTSGFAQWATRISGSGDDNSFGGITSDSNGNIYVLGQYNSNPLTIYNSDGSSFGTLGNSGSNDACFVKYNTSGFAQWATRIGGSGVDSFGGITSDSNGNIYVSGYYTSNPLTIYNSDGSSFGTLGNSGSYDIYVVKFNA